MNKVWQRNIIRAIIILLIQLVLLKRIDITFGEFNYIHFTIYPLIIALLPYKMNKTLLVVVGFSLGFFVDLFYDSIGVHAFTTTFIAYMRIYVLNLLSPTEGYGKTGLTSFSYGIPWFLSYIGILLFMHLFLLYSLEAFSFIYIKEILLRTIFSFMASLFLLTVGQLIFNPKY
ncbi:MAG: hypothetical protein HKO66_16320 [Saprospiraceae bacterium]|nr:hypothetical protein [Bacteroidia bacterium]NNE13441.1 hypothetical protein [Saprospiraceae bacterium]NNL93810.1 hypothetical protein [Saprospiraceae bacterium]